MSGVSRAASVVNRHRMIIWALLMRELSTRYGRDNIGFFWIILEPMIFAAGVSFIRKLIEPAGVGSIPIVPFIITGYLPLILVRNTVNHAASTLAANQALLYHRQVTPLHLFIGRIGLEIVGISLAFAVVVGLACLYGVMKPPPDFAGFGLIYAGWFILAAQTAGMSIALGALAVIFDFIERLVPIVTYLLIPLSGAFFMASMMNNGVRQAVLLLPFIHCFEMIRKGFFGPMMTAYYQPAYAIAWAAGFILLGLILVQGLRDHVEVD